MVLPSLPPLAIPAQSSPSAATHRSNTPNGRPPTWTSSAHRKMTRLYLYTTLPMKNILDIVNAQSPDKRIGKGSANKRLQFLLDKQPRWLRPTDEDDVDRRVMQLANSPTRLGRSPEALFEVANQVKRDPEELPTCDSNGTTYWGAEMELAVPPAVGTSASATQHLNVWRNNSIEFADAQDEDFQDTEGDTPEPINLQRGEGQFATFLRRTTFMSASTNRTTGSIQNNLQGYSPPYVAVIRRLVKRFTSPVFSRLSLSPACDTSTIHESWVADESAPEPFDNYPFPLPGDFLHIDNENLCNVESITHFKGQCLCAARREITESPWVTAKGLTMGARTLLLTWNINVADFTQRDIFGNTVLHFLAARAPTQTLIQALSTNISTELLNAKNSAGQTFLHLIQNQNDLVQLLVVLQPREFDIYAQDVYGRNVFHMMDLKGLKPQALDWILRNYDCPMFGKRDAFDVCPCLLPEHPTEFHGEFYGCRPIELDASHDEPHPALRLESSNDPALSNESQLLQNVRWALRNPHFEDQQGRNGLHCLAKAILSMKSLAEKHNIGEDFQVSEFQDLNNQKDSSTERLDSRLSYAMDLLNAGVDPNHRDKDGNTPLMVFAASLPEDDDYQKGPEILRLLMERGAEVNARNRAGETALHAAVRCHRKLAVRALVGRSGNVHVRDASGRSLLEVIDTKMKSSRDGHAGDYARYEACRAYLSGSATAVQAPTVQQEWRKDNLAIGHGRAR